MPSPRRSKRKNKGKLPKGFEDFNVTLSPIMAANSSTDEDDLDATIAEKTANNQQHDATDEQEHPPVVEVTTSTNTTSAQAAATTASSTGASLTSSTAAHVHHSGMSHFYPSSTLPSNVYTNLNMNAPTINAHPGAPTSVHSSLYGPHCSSQMPNISDTQIFSSNPRHFADHGHNQNNVPTTYIPSELVPSSYIPSSFASSSFAPSSFAPSSYAPSSLVPSSFVSSSYLPASHVHSPCVNLSSSHNQLFKSRPSTNYMPSAQPPCANLPFSHAQPACACLSSSHVHLPFGLEHSTGHIQPTYLPSSSTNTLPPYMSLHPGVNQLSASMSSYLPSSSTNTLPPYMFSHSGVNQLSAPVSSYLPSSSSNPKPPSACPLTSNPLNYNLQSTNSISPPYSQMNVQPGLQPSMGYIQGHDSRRRLHDLPKFDGKPEDWPKFITSYNESNAAYGYSNMENALRLDKAIQGNARVVAGALLIHPHNIPHAIAQLEFTFGRPDILINSQLEHAQQIPSIPEGRLDQLLTFATSVQNLAIFLETANGQQHLYNPTLLCELTRKLPESKQMEWAKYAITLKMIPSIKDFSNWMNDMAKLVSFIVGTVRAKPFNAPPKNKSFKNTILHATTPESKENKSPTKSCIMCQGNHHVRECKKFLHMEVQKRWSFVKEKRLCFSCLAKGHGLFSCRRKRSCAVDKCTKYHHPTLHSEINAETNEINATAFEMKTNKSEEISNENNRVTVVKRQNASIASRPKNVLFKIIPVVLYGKNGSDKNGVATYAMLDEGSSITLMDEGLAKQLNTKSSYEPLTLQWFGSKTTTEPSMTVDLMISDNRKGTKYELKNVKTVKDIELPVQTLNLQHLQGKYHDLKELPIQDYTDVKPQILIGVDNCHLGIAKALVECKKGPCVIKTKLGWVVCGPSETNTPKGEHVNIISVLENEEMHKIIGDYINDDKFGTRINESVVTSDDDQRANRILNETTNRIGNKFETGLLWKSDEVNLPDSFEMAKKRAIAVENKLRKNRESTAEYNQIIESFVTKGYARKMTPYEACNTTSRTWYLPHFMVRNPNKPNKLRCVFDAAAMVDGVSLNSMLLKGPDQYKPMPYVLFNFRMGKIGVFADIKEMFSQVKIRKEDQDSQRFLWRDCDLDKTFDVYVMESMIQGSASSPCSAQYVKNKNAKEFIQESERAVDAIIDYHWVDDYADSFADTSEAISICCSVRDIHSYGGFELRNFVSNSNEVMAALKGQDTPNNLEISMDMEGATEKVLGMQWNTAKDVFTFKLKFHGIHNDVFEKSIHPTKRQLLSIIMSVFDPFGFIANFLIYGKILLQKLWKCGVEWDDKIPDVLNKEWIRWRDELPNVSNFKLNRCYSERLLSPTIRNLQLHVFVDASEQAFAAVAYLRIESEYGVEVTFVAGKTKCAPQKFLSIPKLELQAAVLGLRLRNTIIEGHKLNLTRSVFWSDSKTVLSWIASDHRKYKPFVAHRVAELLESSKINEWRWVPTKLNVADDATRTRAHPKFESESHWINGPEFLKQDELMWPVMVVNEAETPEELRPSYQCLVIDDTQPLYPSLIDINRFSDYLKLQRVTAWALRFINNIKRKFKGKGFKRGELSVMELEQAEILLCRQTQSELFNQEKTQLIQGKPINQKSPIYSLTPILDENGLLRVNGRINYATTIPLHSRNPIILLKDHKLAYLITHRIHRLMIHQNDEAIIARIRQKFWVPSLRVLLKNVKSTCNICKLIKARPQVPQMGQLPPDRLTPYVRPFTYTGLDYFGPITITVNRHHEKRWVALFTCLTTRALHLELATDLSADACIICIRNFCNRRGLPTRIRSDNGTNFVRANKELCFKENAFDNEKMTAALATKGIEWVFNCPSNPSAGGCWERMVRAVKRVLNFTLKETAPRQDTLISLLIEAENIVNSRPLTHIPVSCEEDEPLTPNHFLLGGMNCTQVPGELEDRLWCLRKQWRIAQALKNKFWKRWIAEYLPELTRRSKWYGKVTPLKSGDLVLVCDDGLPRGQWQRGRVVETFPAPDGQVRSASVRVAGRGILKRPASKLAILDVVTEEDGESIGMIHGARDVAN